MHIVLQTGRKSRLQTRIDVQRDAEMAARERQLNYWRSVRQGIAEAEQRYGSRREEVRYYIAIGCVMAGIAVAGLLYWWMR